MSNNERPRPTTPEEENDSPNRRGRLLAVAAGGLTAAALTAVAIGVGVEAKGHGGSGKEVSAKEPATTAPANPGHETAPAKTPESQPSTQPPHFEVMGETYDSTGEDTVDKIAKSFEIPSDLSVSGKNNKILEDFNAIINTRDGKIRKLVVKAAKKALVGKEVGGDADGMQPPAALFSTIEDMARKVSAFNDDVPADHEPYRLTLSVNKEMDGKGIIAMPFGAQTDITTLLKTKESGGHHESLSSNRVLHYVLKGHDGNDKLISALMDETAE